MQRVVVTEDRRGAAEEPAQRRAGLTADDILASPFVLLGSLEEIAAQLVARRTRWGLSGSVVFDSVIDAFAPIVERLTGL